MSKILWASTPTLFWILFTCDYVEYCHTTDPSPNVDHKAFSTSTERADSWMDNFVHMSVFVCKPHVTTIQCPHRMHIRPLDFTEVSRWPDTLLPGSVNPNCVWPKTERGEHSSAAHRTGCLRSDTKSRIRHSCEGRNLCTLESDQLQDNRTECHASNMPVRIEYQCLPDRDTVLFEAICADTYMDVKCDGQLARHNSLVILTARLDRVIDHVPNSHRQGCPVVQQTDTQNNNCLNRLDVTSEIQGACNGQSSCSVNPNTVTETEMQNVACGKMHLSLTYVCVPSEWVAGNKREVHMAEATKRLKAQRQPKGLTNTKPVGPASVANPSVSNDASTRDTRQLPNVPPESATKQNTENAGGLNVQPVDGSETASQNTEISLGFLQPLFIGIGIGLALLLIILGLFILVCRQRQRTSCLKDQQLRRQVLRSGQLNCVHECESRRSSSCSKTTEKRSRRVCPSCSHDQAELQHRLPLNNGSHPDKCYGVSMGAHSGSNCALMQESFHPYRNCTSGAHFASGITGLDSSGLSIPNDNTKLLYPQEITPQTIILGHQNSGLETGLNASPAVYGSPFTVLTNSDGKGHRVDSSVYSGTGVLRGSSVNDSCSGRGCDGGSGTSDPCEVVQYGSPFYKQYVPSVYPGISRKPSDLFDDQLHNSVSQQDIYPHSTDGVRYAAQRTAEFVPEYEQSTIGLVDRSGRNKPGSDLSPALVLRSMNDHNPTRSVHDTLSPTPNSNMIGMLPSRSYGLVEFMERDSDTSQFPVGTAHQFDKPKTLKLFREVGGSAESLTEPLIEPPSNFRTSAHVNYLDLFHYDKRQSNDRSPTLSLNEHTATSMNRPPDLILKDGSFLTKNLELPEEEEIPLPPPPLRVFGTNGFSQTRTISRKEKSSLFRC